MSDKIRINIGQLTPYGDTLITINKATFQFKYVLSSIFDVIFEFIDLCGNNKLILLDYSINEEIHH